MRTQSLDTPPEIERLQIERIRNLSFMQKFASICASSEMLVYANLHEYKSDESRQNVILARTAFIARQYGSELAALFDEYAQDHPTWTPGQFDIQAALLAMIKAIVGARYTYAISGQLACSLYGFPRAVLTCEALTDALLPLSSYPICWVAAPAVEMSVKQMSGQAHARIRAIDSSSLVQIDLLSPPAKSFLSGALHRARDILLMDSRAPVRMITPEDCILLELAQLADAKEQDDDQWNDVVGMLKVQADSLDMASLMKRGAQLGCSAMLRQAMGDAGMA